MLTVIQSSLLKVSFECLTVNQGLNLFVNLHSILTQRGSGQKLGDNWAVT